MPAQSMSMASAACDTVPRYAIGGVPVGTELPPFWLYPGVPSDARVGTATPATGGLAPHASVPPRAPVPPFFVSPLMLDHPPGTVTDVTRDVTYCATMRSAVGALGS